MYVKRIEHSTYIMLGAVSLYNGTDASWSVKENQERQSSEGNILLKLAFRL